MDAADVVKLPTFYDNPAPWNEQPMSEPLILEVFSDYV